METPTFSLRVNYRMVSLIGLALLPLVIAPASRAATMTFEAAPFVGYRIGGTINIDHAVYEDVTIVEAPAYGLTIGYEVNDEGHLEIMWSRQHDTNLRGRTGGIGSGQTLFHTRIDQYHLNGLYLWGDREERIRPFILFGLGATHLSPVPSDVDGAFRFSFGLGGGVKLYLGDHLGIRLQGRWAPTYISSGSAIYCSTPGYCYIRTVGEFIHQIEFTAGMILRF